MRQKQAINRYLAMDFLNEVYYVDMIGGGEMEKFTDRRNAYIHVMEIIQRQGIKGECSQAFFEYVQEQSKHVGTW